MANSNDAIFKIDANQILAKLDAAAGQQAAKCIKHYTINTGVKDPPDNPDPKNIGKIINVKITDVKTWSMDGEIVD